MLFYSFKFTSRIYDKSFTEKILTMIGRLKKATEKLKFLSCTHLKNWKCMMSTNLQKKYFLLYEDPKNSTKVLRIALFAGVRVKLI